MERAFDSSFLCYNINIEGSYMSKPDNFHLIDLFKFFFALCIIGIHTYLFSNINGDLDWYGVHLLFRLAVPFFFVVSGFFVGLKLLQSDSTLLIVRKTVNRLFLPFIFWLAISLPLQFINYNFIEIIRRMVFYPWGALWYVLALIIALLALSPFYVKKKYGLPVIIGFILYLFALLSNSYYFLIENTAIGKFVDWYIEHFISSRNGLFVGFFFVSLGVYLSKLYLENKLIGNKHSIVFLISIITLFLETAYIRDKHYLDDNSLFISLPFVVASLLMFLIKFKSDRYDFKELRYLSVGIYFIHRPILYYLDYFLI